MAILYENLHSLYLPRYKGRLSFIMRWSQTGITLFLVTGFAFCSSPGSAYSIVFALCVKTIATWTYSQQCGFLVKFWLCIVLGNIFIGECHSCPSLQCMDVYSHTNVTQSYWCITFHGRVVFSHQCFDDRYMILSTYSNSHVSHFNEQHILDINPDNKFK